MTADAAARRYAAWVGRGIGGVSWGPYKALYGDDVIEVDPLDGCLLADLAKDSPTYFYEVDASIVEAAYGPPCSTLRH